MFKKVLLTIFIFTLFLAQNTQVAGAAAVFKDSTVISKDVLLQAYPLKTISSAAQDEGDYVYFINPSDLWAYEVNVLPKNSYFRGRIDMLKMPVKGVNGAMVIKITEVILPDGTIKKISGVVTQNGKEQVGGDLTPPASYNMSVHPRKGIYWQRTGVLQYVPSGEYEMGVHITLPTNETVIIKLLEDYDSEAPAISREEME